MCDKYKFYTVCDNDGMISVVHPDYENLKAIFDNEPDALNCLEKAKSKYPDVEFEIVGVRVLED